jgi:hypothetical protein
MECAICIFKNLLMIRVFTREGIIKYSFLCSCELKGGIIGSSAIFMEIKAITCEMRALNVRCNALTAQHTRSEAGARRQQWNEVEWQFSLGQRPRSLDEK